MEKLKRKTQEIIKEAFKLWDIKDWSSTEIDPVVNLLFAACANESINLEALIKESIYKTKDSIIHDFLPPSLLAAKPACAMVKATPLEPDVVVSKNLIFNYNTFLTKDNNKEPFKLEYKPFLETKLFNIKPRYKYDGNTLVSFLDGPTMLAEKQHHNSQSIWYGFEIDDSIDSFDCLSFYLSFKESIEIGSHLVNEFNFHDNLSLYFENEELSLRNGFNVDNLSEVSAKFGNVLAYNKLLFFDILKESLSYFEDGYYKISEPARKKNQLVKRRYPEKFSTLFDNTTLELMEDEIIWLEFRFDTISIEELQKINIVLNAFPVFNFREVVVNLSKEEPIQQIPVRDSEHFIAVTEYSIYDDYHDIIEFTDDNINPYVIRNVDMEKFSGHDLQELLDKIIDKYQTDYHAFQEDYNLTADDVNKLREAMKPLQSEKIQTRTASKRNKTFALLNSKNNRNISSVTITTCLTNGQTGNQPKSGEKLNPSGSFIDPESIELVTKAIGGRDPLSGNEKSNAVRNLILSNNQIITYEDIKSFCIAELGDMLNHISINDGAMRGDFGLRKCTLVRITLDKSFARGQNLHIIRQNLENKIKRRSSLIIPVIVNLSIS